MEDYKKIIDDLNNEIQSNVEYIKRVKLDNKKKYIGICVAMILSLVLGLTIGFKVNHPIMMSIITCSVGSSYSIFIYEALKTNNNLIDGVKKTNNQKQIEIDRLKEEINKSQTITKSGASLQNISRREIKPVSSDKYNANSLASNSYRKK